MSSDISFSDIATDRREKYVERLEAFEKAWRAGQRPLIKDVLEGTSGGERRVLFQHALRLELELRRERGESPAPDNYLLNFSDEADLIAQVFAEEFSPTSEETVQELQSLISEETVFDQLPIVPGYEIIKELGRGGQSVVYLASDLSLNKRKVALKMVRVGWGSPEERRRVQGEMNALAELNHPNVVKIHSVGEHNGLPFLSLEYVSGGTLADRIQGVPQPVRSAARFVQMLARVVHDIHHGYGLVHRDLKPSNILLEGEPNLPLKQLTPKVSDFGLVKYLNAGQGRTVDGAILGTPSYMAPEQAEGKNQEVGPRSDVYALGAILYECLTGRPPFTGDTVPAILWQVCNMDPVPPGQLNPAVDRGLAFICLKCLEKEPERRYDSAAALADDLGRWLVGEGPVPPGPGELIVRQFQLPCRIDRVSKWAGLFFVLAGWRVLCHGVMTVLLQVDVAPAAYWAWFLGLLAGDWLLVWRWLYSEARLDPTERGVVLNWAAVFGADALLLAIFCPLWGQARPEEIVRVYSAWLAVRGLWYVMEARRSWGRFYAVGFGFLILTPLLSLCGLLAPAAYALISASAHLWLGAGFYRLAQRQRQMSGSNGAQTREGNNGKQ